MREQFKVLTEKVEKQKIVNERLLESSVKSKVDKYTGGKKGWISIIIIAYIVYIDIEYCIKYNLPLWCTIVVGAGFSIMVLISICNKLKSQKELDFKGDVVGGSYWRNGRKASKGSEQSKLHLDTIHLNAEGHYLQACTWLAALFGTDMTKLPYAPKTLSPEKAKLMRACAAEAVAAERAARTAR